MQKSSRLSYAETVARLSQAIAGGGNTLFASIDQSRAAAGVGLTLRPTTLLVFGNPRGGTPLMETFPAFALELPLKMVVWEDGGGVQLAYANVAEIAARYGIPADTPQVAAMDRALEALSATVT